MMCRGSATTKPASAKAAIGARNGPAPNIQAATDPRNQPNVNQSGAATIRFMATWSDSAPVRAIAYWSRYSGRSQRGDQTTGKANL